jgi:hypothetical protein
MDQDQRQALLDDSFPPRVVSINWWDTPVGTACPEWVTVGMAYLGGDQWGEHPDDTVRRLTDAVQRHLDETAQARGYDHILSCCTYATSRVPRFAAEGQVAVEWRDACWTRAYDVMHEVVGGARPVPTEAELIQLLPEVAWPT